MRLILFYLIGMLIGLESLFSLPRASYIPSGSIEISRPNWNTMNIRTFDPVTIIYWSDFSINYGETVRIIQPKNSLVFNVARGRKMSKIFGNLSSNEIVFLINASGATFSKQANVDTSAFIFSTLPLVDQNEESQAYHFLGGSDASCKNEGVIRARNGDVVLIAREVSNEGRISTLNGVEHLISSKDVQTKIHLGREAPKVPIGR